MGEITPNEIGQAEFYYLRDTIAHVMAYHTIQPKRFNRLAYKRMIIKIATLHYGKTSYAEIGKTIGRSSERVRQILYKFYRLMRRMIEKENL